MNRTEQFVVFGMRRRAVEVLILDVETHLG